MYKRMLVLSVYLTILLVTVGCQSDLEQTQIPTITGPSTNGDLEEIGNLSLIQSLEQPCSDCPPESFIARMRDLLESKDELDDLCERILALLRSGWDLYHKCQGSTLPQCVEMVETYNRLFDFWWDNC